MILLVRCNNCSPPTSYLPRVGVRVATVSKASVPQYRYVRIYVGLIHRDQQCDTAILRSRRQLPDQFRFKGAYRIHFGSTSQWYLLQPKCQAVSGINLFHPCWDACAIHTILFIIYICSELNIPLLLPAVIMEDNSAVVTVSNEESAYLKKWSWS